MSPERPMTRYPVKAVLFDLDGTLLDTIPDLAEAARRMMLELGRPPHDLEAIRRFVGKGIPNLVRRCLTEGGTATEAEIEAALPVFRRHYAVVNGVCTTIYPGVVETLSALQAQGLPLGCVTNKADAFTRPLMERMGLAGYFGVIVSGDTTPAKKPDPAPLFYACRHLSVAPAEALMIGDSANDALAARAAGMPVLLMTYGYSEGQAVDSIDCDGLLSDFADALSRIAVA